MTEPHSLRCILSPQPIVLKPVFRMQDWFYQTMPSMGRLLINRTYRFQQGSARALCSHSTPTEPLLLFCIILLLVPMVLRHTRVCSCLEMLSTGRRSAAAVLAMGQCTDSRRAG